MNVTELVRLQRRDQGLTERVSDESALRRLAGLVLERGAVKS